MERPIEVMYNSKDEITNEMVYKISVYITVPTNVENIKHHLIAEYKKANVVDHLIDRLNEY